MQYLARASRTVLADFQLKENLHFLEASGLEVLHGQVHRGRSGQGQRGFPPTS